MAEEKLINQSQLSSESAIQEQRPSEEDTGPKDSKLKALIAMNIAAISVTGMAACQKAIADEGFHPAEFSAMRNFASLVIGLIWCRCQNLSPVAEFPSHQKQTMFWRVMTGQANFVFLNIAIIFAPISLVVVIWQTNPFFLSICAFFILGEPIIPLEIVGIFICFGAVATITWSARATAEEEDSVVADYAFKGLLVALAASIVEAFCAVTSRALKATPTSVIVVWHTVGGFSLSVIYIIVEALITGERLRILDYTGRQYLIASGASLFDSGALLFSTMAYQADSSGFVGLVSYMHIVYAYFGDQLLYNPQLKPAELIGAITILVVAVGIAYYKIRQAKKKLLADDQFSKQ